MGSGRYLRLSLLEGYIPGWWHDQATPVGGGRIAGHYIQRETMGRLLSIRQPINNEHETN